MKVALTGGIACGKSLLARFLNELGVKTIDADDVAHELIPDPAERRRIAAEVFADPAKRRELEARLHPQIKARIDEFFEVVVGSPSCRNEGGNFRSTTTTPDYNSNSHSLTPPLPHPSTPPNSNPKLRLAIIPLLFETHWDSEYDIICCVASTRDIQISRMVRQRGYTREEAEARLAAQMPVEEKAAKSHYVIENNGTTEELKAKAKSFVEWLLTQRSCSV